MNEPAGTSALRKPLELAAAEVAAKALNFLAFVSLARALGANQFGIVEFASSFLLYFALLADAGLEAWGVRQIAQGGEVRDLAARVTVLRVFTSSGGFVLLLCLLPLVPNTPPLREVALLFGLSLFPQAVTLKWIFVGTQRMAVVGAGLFSGQLMFTVGALALVHDPTGILWVPILKVAGDCVTAVYFGRRYIREHGARFTWVQLREASRILPSASIIGLSAALHLMNYNFDLILLGFLTNPMTVGWYSAAYRPVTVALALPMAFLVGLYPGLARSYGAGSAAFRAVMTQSVALMVSIAVPLGVGGAMLSRPIVDLLFGPAYEPSIPVLRILVCSASLVIVRGPFHRGLVAADRAGVELRCAMAAAAVNVALNLVLIPRYGMLGAALATLIAEVAWVTLLVNRLKRHVTDIPLLTHLWRPLVAGVAMAGCLWFVGPSAWAFGAILSLAVYLAVLALVGGVNRRGWLSTLNPSGRDLSV